MKRVYLSPKIAVHNIETSCILDTSRTNPETKPVAPDNNGSYGGGLGGSTGSDGEPPETARGTGHNNFIGILDDIDNDF